MALLAEHTTYLANMQLAYLDFEAKVAQALEVADNPSSYSAQDYINARIGVSNTVAIFKAYLAGNGAAPGVLKLYTDPVHGTGATNAGDLLATAPVVPRLLP